MRTVVRDALVVCVPRSRDAASIARSDPPRVRFSCNGSIAVGGSTTFGFTVNDTAATPAATRTSP
ncbi:hypothetical protein [Microbispora bryophytorum]|uniref:hypothetical protein n=1 Tax=Microbispora bryophytorum TaxID=1460882 RepID=UPI00340BB4EF